MLTFFVQYSDRIFKFVAIFLHNGCHSSLSLSPLYVVGSEKTNECDIVGIKRLAHPWRVLPKSGISFDVIKVVLSILCIQF